MRQGTVSVLVGSHSVIHSSLVLIAWCKLYRRFPSFSELVCIFLHDIGHIGKDYLDDVMQKREHWRLGANIASFFFGPHAYMLVAGHDEYSGYPISKLRKPDKYSWYIAPDWFLKLNRIVEPKLGATSSIEFFKARVKENIESGRYGSSHDIYLEGRERLSYKPKHHELDMDDVGALWNSAEGMIQDAKSREEESHGGKNEQR